MTARTIASRLLENDEDFDPLGEIKRMTTTHPGYSIESEGPHWNVYKDNRGFIGEITYDDMADMPKETMTPENIAYWDSHRWYAKWGWRDNEHKMCKSFEDAVNLIIAVNAVKTRPVRESEADPDDPQANIERFAIDRSVPVEMHFINGNGRPFRVRLVWDELAGGTAYDSQGNVIPEKPQPTVEFYDMTRAQTASSFKDHGQYVSSYSAATLIDRPMHAGLDLYGGERLWIIDGKSMDTIMAWVKEQVESRGYKLVDDAPGGISFGRRYETLDPDDPELYVKPEQFSSQPSEEKIESSLRVMLRPYYPEVRINRRPGLFSRRGASIGGKPIEDSYVWTIHCNRDTELPLPINNRYGVTPYVDWRKLATQWFHDWAQAHGLHIFKFEIFGRLRKDPTFQFETSRIGPLKEDEDELSPETILASYVDKDAAQEDLLHALWNFHPYGVSYNVLLGPRGGFALATLYFPPEKDNFYQRFEAFVVDWITKRKLFQVTSTKLTGGKHANSEPYPRWGLTLALNSDWPSDTAPYVPAPVETGQP